MPMVKPTDEIKPTQTDQTNERTKKKTFLQYKAAWRADRKTISLKSTQTIIHKFSIQPHAFNHKPYDKNLNSILALNYLYITGKTIANIIRYSE